MCDAGLGFLKPFPDRKRSRGNKTRSLTPPRPSAGRPDAKNKLFRRRGGLSAGVWLLANVKLIYFSNLMLEVCEGVHAGKLSAL